jgi:plastocyanin
MIRRLLAGSAAAGAALAVAGCGSSGASGAGAKGDSGAMGGMVMSQSTAAQPAGAATSSRVRSGHVTVEITNFAFKPAMLTVKAGTRVTFVNHDKTAHTATADHGGFGTGSIAPGDRKTIRLTRSGRFPYHCLFHAFMTGTVTVTRS